MNRGGVAIAAAEARLRQLCSVGLPGPLVAPALFRELNEVVPFETCGYTWFDDRGVADVYFNAPEVGRSWQLFQDRWFRRAESSVWVTLDEAVRSGFGLHHLHQSLKIPTAAFRRHPIYQEVLRPCGHELMLRFLVRDGSRLLGALNIARRAEDRDFEPGDLRTLARLQPFIALAMRSREPVATADDRGADRALLVIDRMGHLRWSSPAAQHLLSLAAGSALAPPDLPDGVLHAVRTLQRVADGDADARAPVWQHANAWGRFVARAYWLDPHEPAESLIGIELERRVPLPMRLYEAVRERHLPEAQADVCLSLALGRTEGEIATRLGVSRNTVVYHRRQIYNRLGIDSRRELRERLLTA